MEEYITACQYSVEIYLEAERMPYTQNIDELHAAKDEWLSSHVDRAECRVDYASTTPQSEEDSIQKQYTNIWLPLLTPGWTSWLEASLDSPYMRESTVMAEVSAYFEVSWSVCIFGLGL